MGDNSYEKNKRSVGVVKLLACLSTSVVDSDPDPGGQNDPQISKKERIFMFRRTGCSLLRAEGFSCSLGIIYGGLGISK
jgi:hypothetical protein